MGRRRRELVRIVHVRVEVTVLEGIDRMCADLGLTRSDVVRQALGMGIPQLREYWTSRSEGAAEWKSQQGSRRIRE